MIPFFKAPTQGRVVVVTGASAGVGRAIAREFAKEKAKIGLIARCEERLHSVRKEIESLGGQAIVLPLDVSDFKAVKNAAIQVEKEFGPIDVWVNNAMVSVFSPVEQMQPEEYQRVTQVTYLGTVYGTLTALDRMKSHQRGLIIQIGSALGFRSIPLQSAYCAAKHAIVGFTESLRSELLHQKSHIKICLVNLPAVNTPQFSWVKSRLPRQPQPVPPIYQPEMIADVVRKMSHRPRRRINIAFSTQKAMLAEKVAPAIADHYLASMGYRSQQTDQPISLDRPNNLWQTVPGEFGARGVFSSQARSFSPTLWINLNRAPLFLIGGVVAIFASILKYRKSPPIIEKIFEEDQRVA